jgi:hypothetical protein
VKAQQLRAKYHQNHLIYPWKGVVSIRWAPPKNVHIIYIIMYLYTFFVPWYPVISSYQLVIYIYICYIYICYIYMLYIYICI